MRDLGFWIVVAAGAGAVGWLTYQLTGHLIDRALAGKDGG